MLLLHLCWKVWSLRAERTICSQVSFLKTYTQTDTQCQWSASKSFLYTVKYFLFISKQDPSAVPLDSRGKGISPFSFIFISITQTHTHTLTHTQRLRGSSHWHPKKNDFVFFSLHTLSCNQQIQKTFQRLLRLTHFRKADSSAVLEGHSENREVKLELFILC